MKLCTFRAGSRFGAMERVGAVTPRGRIVDLNFAYALALTEREGHPTAYELADALLPPDMMGFLANGRWARQAADEALAHLGTGPMTHRPPGRRASASSSTPRTCAS